MFDAYVDFNDRIIVNLNTLLDAPPADCGSYTEISSVFTANLHQSSPQEPDWNTLRQFFYGHPHPASTMSPPGMELIHTPRITSKSNPVFNIPRCSEAVATDTIFSDTPAVDDSSAMAHIFCDRDTLVCDAYGIKSTKQFINTLSDNIRKQGAMDTLISDGGNMKSPSKSLISSVPYSSKIISLNIITNTKIRLKINLDLPSITPTLS